MSATRSFETAGTWFFDGDRPVACKVEHLEISFDQKLLRISPENGGAVDWPLDDIRRVPDHAGRGSTCLHCKQDPLARLFTTNLSVLNALPRPNRPAPPKGRGRLAVWAGAAVLAVVVQVFVLIPIMADQMAAFIPPKGERALGEATLAQIQRALGDTAQSPIRVCTNPDGVAALQKMETALSTNISSEQPFSVHVLDHEMVNAFALPGGYVTFFDGLIQAADTPEEVAAVFAHEMGHVVSRDPTRHALRSAGSIGILGLLFGDFAGGAVVLFLTERLIDAQYAQGAEASADDFATRVLLDAGVSPAALGDFFDRLREKYGESDGLVAHFMSHPKLGDRIEASRASVPEGVEFQPILTATEWEALQGICD